MKVRYGGGRSVLVKGSVTGAEYRFSGTERLQLVDPRDAIGITRNPLFRIEGLVELPRPSVTFVRRRESHDA
jgi:hypothetical protein